MTDEEYNTTRNLALLHVALDALRKLTPITSLPQESISSVVEEVEDWAAYIEGIFDFEVDTPLKVLPPPESDEEEGELGFIPADEYYDEEDDDMAYYDGVINSIHEEEDDGSDNIH